MGSSQSQERVDTGTSWFSSTPSSSIFGSPQNSNTYGQQSSSWWGGRKRKSKGKKKMNNKTKRRR